MLISIIVPVYNMQKFLPDCIESIRKQTYRNLEIILINDGSTDNSGQICDELSKRDSRIVVIHKENGGVSSARNIGLKVANGQYIGFVDPDDWIDSTMFENLMKNIIKYQAEISICGYYKENRKGEILNNLPLSQQIVELNSTEALNSIIDLNGFRGFLCNKLFSVDILKKKPYIFLDEQIYFCEDLLFCCESFCKANTIIFDTTPYYHYIIHDKNMTKQLSIRKLTGLLSLEKIINLFTEKKVNVDLKKYKNYYMHLNLSLLMNGIEDKSLSSAEISLLKSNLYKYRFSELADNFIRILCFLARLNIKITFFFWKNLKNKN